MIRLDAGTSGAREVHQPDIDSLEIDEPWKQALHAFCPGGTLRPAQYRVLAEATILDSRRNLVVCAPTNGGKSLVGHLLLIDELRRAGGGARAVLIEPLRALARERADELRELLPRLSPALIGRKVKVTLTTGDLRLDGERMSAPPPLAGELVVATPERLEAIARRTRHREWLESLRAVVIDEAHLIGDAHRGATLELLIASLRTLPTPPRLALLSATIGDPERIRRWLDPCDLVKVTTRTPPLHKEVLVLEEGEDTNEIVRRELERILQAPSASVLVFVYQRNSADRLARRLGNGKGALAYHAGLTTHERQAIRKSFIERKVRCVVTTTALGLGINLPATHVLVRDTSFYSRGPAAIGVSSLLQMLGRAGRGSEAGRGLVFLKPSDRWTPPQLVEALRNEQVEELRSVLDLRARGHGAEVETTAAIALASLARAGDEGMTRARLRALLRATLTGGERVAALSDALAWLEAPSRCLAWRDEKKHYHLTVLGRRGARVVLPPRYIAGLGQLVRDLLELDPSFELIERWSSFDHLIVTCLLAPEGSHRSPTSVLELRSQLEVAEVHSLLFSEWFSVDETGASTLEVLGSLGLGASLGRTRRERQALALKLAKSATARALLLWESRREGATLERGNGGEAERWRNQTLWLLTGHAELLELRSFYFHLRNTCDADRAQITRAKRGISVMRRQCWDLLKDLAARGARRTNIKRI